MGPCRRLLAGALAAFLLTCPSARVCGQTLLSTYLGGPDDDRLSATAVCPDGSIVLAGTIPGDAAFRWGKGKGIVLRLSPKGDQVLSTLRLDGPVNALAAGPAGQIYVTGSFGTAKLDTATRVVWSVPVGGDEARVAAGPGGGAVVLAENTITVLSAAGKVQKEWQVAGVTSSLDLACDAANGLVYTTGFSHRRGRPAGQKSLPVQVAFVRAYDLRGRQLWSAYDWSGQDVADRALLADTRGVRLALAGGGLYLAGEGAGGNTLWTRQSQDLDKMLPLAKGDRYQNAANVRSAPITFLARLDPKTGKAESGTLLLTRLPDNKGNALRPRALAVDAEGRVYVGGSAAQSPALSEGAFGAGPGSGAYLGVLDRAWQRLYSTRLCAGTTTGVAVGAKVVVAVGETTGGLPTVAPHQARPGGKNDGWAVVFTRAR